MVATGAHIPMQENPHYYQDLLEGFIDYPNPCFNQIDLDLKRTQIMGEYSEQAASGRQQVLQNVLIAYTRRNPRVGYCQGLNLVVARLLDYLQEEEAFWVLTRIIEVIIPLDFYSNMMGVLVQQHILKDMLAIRDPKLSRHFQNMDLDPTIPSMQWFVTLFANTLHYEVVHAAWDMLFLRGSVTLMEICLALYDFVSPYLIRTKDFCKCNKQPSEQAFKELESLPKALADPSILLKRIFSKKCKLSSKTLRSYRETKAVIMMGDLRLNEKAKFGLLKNPEDFRHKYFQSLFLLHTLPIRVLLNSCTVEQSQKVSQILRCNPLWPVCVYDSFYKSKHLSYFCFRLGTTPKILPNYFGGEYNDQNCRSEESDCYDDEMPTFTDPSSFLNKNNVSRQEEFKIEESVDPSQTEPGKIQFDSLIQDEDTSRQSAKTDGGAIEQHLRKRVQELRENGVDQQQQKWQTPPHFDLPLYNRLLIERNTHYCRHHRFLEKIGEVLMLRNNPALHKLVKDSMDLAQNRDFEQTVLSILRERCESTAQYATHDEHAVESHNGLRVMQNDMLDKLKRKLTVFEEEEQNKTIGGDLEEDHLSSENEEENVRCFTIEDETSFPLVEEDEQKKERCMTMADNPSPASHHNALSKYFNSLSVEHKEKLIEADEGSFFTQFLKPQLQ